MNTELEDNTMSKTIEIDEVFRWLQRYPAKTNALDALEDWLKSKLWEPKVGEVCEFSNDENFPDSDTYIGYFVGKTAKGFLVSNRKNHAYQIPHTYVRPIKGVGE